MTPYKEQYPVGTRVRIASRERLEDFKRTWRFHHPLTDNQLSLGGRDGTIREVSYYHGGDALYVLDGLPGIWHEQCLSAVEKEGVASASSEMPSKEQRIVAIEERVFLTLDRADFALSLEEVADRSGVSPADVETELSRLVATGRVKLTATRASRTYYTRSQQLF